ncbi:acetamidase/formamidase family protein [Granulicella sp. dw_53]|uniref:acetamidase/formamidase family protein n=1 Tax=Granulicella sp. dw_53 TaxID=2719792 RepID=UPI001BD3CA1D|nr:acetamidase/formamidase family protein [Granulicella sp. dw_53]
MLKLICVVTLACSIAPAQEKSIAGDWIVDFDYLGSKMYDRTLIQDTNGSISGTLLGQRFVGTRTGTKILFRGTTGGAEGEATLTRDGFRGSEIIPSGPQDPHPLRLTFVATRVPPRPSRPPLTHTFKPSVFYRSFSALNPPALNIAPGDTVRTETVDNAGIDGENIRRTAGGDPQTGPFYVDSAMPGDVLAVHILRLTLNRDTAQSDDVISYTAMNRDLAVMTKDNKSAVTWHLDRNRMVAWPEGRSGHLSAFEVPLHPMLGGIGTATIPGPPAPPTFDSGNSGGNMDFNEVGAGATVYLPVNVPGALLYLGDAHALQGDGELNGAALETSMDVEFSVDLIPNKNIKTPRVETPDYIAAIGFDGSVDGALKAATDSMADWLAKDYDLTASEIGQVLGVAAEYRVAEVADRNAGVALKIRKDLLLKLKK